MSDLPKQSFKDFLNGSFRRVDEVVYALIGVFLIATACLTLFSVLMSILHYFDTTHDLEGLVNIIDRIMLTLMIVEILYTVRISLLHHYITAEPFLIVGLIAAIRRILVISVESGYLAHENPDVFMSLLTEIAVLGVMVLLFVGAIIMLRKWGKKRDEGIDI